MKAVHCLLIGLLFAAFAVVAEETEKEKAGKAAVAVAEKWLGLVDDGKYGESWKEAAELFRNAIKADQWEQTIQAGRKPFGKLISRKLKTTSYETNLPGAPDGEYVIIQFETRFENKKEAIETVTPMKDKDGQWRVSGYYVR